MNVKKSLNVKFDGSPPPTKLSPLVDDEVGEEEATKNNTKVVNNNNKEDESIEVDEFVNIKESKNHPLDQVILSSIQRVSGVLFCFDSTLSVLFSMGSFRSKDDDVLKISTSIFITNFLETFSAKDLFLTCQQYGHVVDSFIPVKRSNGDQAGSSTKDRSFINMLKGVSDTCPAIVIEDDCLLNKDLSVALMGRVNEFSSLLNIKNALMNEGFVDINVRYLGELWIHLEFSNTNTRDAFSANMSAHSWFSVLRPASNDFFIDGRIVWVEVEGVPFKLWSGNTFNRISSKWGKLIDIDDKEGNYFHSKRLCVHTKIQSNIFKTFTIIYRGKVFWVKAKEVPGWEPDFLEESDEDVQSEEDLVNGDDEKLAGAEKSAGVDKPIGVDKSAGMDNVKESESRDHPPGFTPSGAENFNSFIMNAGLDEVLLGGSAFTWCHKSASKMSKLDCFLVSENLLALYPNISAITLDRFLSDHRPILLRESSHDYGPCPFRFYHYWLEIDGFSKLVNDS
nr:nucleotide-binding alpha-beta plait domain-containing protein [Tanacetum cinerariifolium]